MEQEPLAAQEPLEETQPAPESQEEQASVSSETSAEAPADAAVEATADASAVVQDDDTAQDTAEDTIEDIPSEPRAEAQAEAEAEPSGEPSALDNIKRKMQFTGTVLRTTLAGALVDIGLETPGVVHISQLQSEPVNRVEDVVQPGQQVEVWVRRVFPKKNRIELTMIKPLDLEWREIAKDMVVKGKVTRLEKFGVFVDIGAERPGLVHISEMTHDYIKSPSDLVKEGDEVEVKVLNVNRQKKQIKLSMKALEEPPVKVVKEVQKETPRPSGGGGGGGGEPEAKEEPVPTAMEMALREAMERSREREETQPEIVKGKRKSGQQKNEIEDILARTLKHRNRSGK